MKTVSFTLFRKKASDFIEEVKRGESFVILKYGKPVAEIIPISKKNKKKLSWKEPGIKLKIKGSNLSSAILEERENSK